MKKLFAVLITFTLLFTACSTDAGKDNNGGSNTTTTLEIGNQSSKTISAVFWNNVSFVSKENADVMGTWTRDGNNFTFQL